VRAHESGLGYLAIVEPAISLSAMQHLFVVVDFEVVR